MKLPTAALAGVFLGTALLWAVCADAVMTSPCNCPGATSGPASGAGTAGRSDCLLLCALRTDVQYLNANNVACATPRMQASSASRAVCVQLCSNRTGGRTTREHSVGILFGRIDRRRHPHLADPADARARGGPARTRLPVPADRSDGDQPPGRGRGRTAQP